MKFRFEEGATVQLNVDYPALDLPAGSIGIVWALYDTKPQAYEVTFRDSHGKPFDMTVSEEELSDVPSILPDTPVPYRDATKPTLLK